MMADSRVFLAKMMARFQGAQEQDQFISVLPQVMEHAKSVNGFIHVDFWVSALDHRLLLEDSYWESREAAEEWRGHPFHQELQKLGYERLIAENTTSWWESTGEANVFVKCPVCSTADRSEYDVSRAIGRDVPIKCGNCGFLFPSTPIVEVTDKPVWQTLPGGMDVIK